MIAKTTLCSVLLR